MTRDPLMKDEGSTGCCRTLSDEGLFRDPLLWPQGHDLRLKAAEQMCQPDSRVLLDIFRGTVTLKTRVPPTNARRRMTGQK
jgi:hypothetical protein